MKSWQINRRTMLRGTCAALSLPLLDIMRDETHGKETSTPPTRVAYFYFPNGAADGTWEPEETGRDGRLLKLNRWMSPLEPLKDDLIIPRNVWTPRGNGHAAGTATWLTGHGYDGRRIDAGGTSVDQIAAKYLAGETLLPSLELSTQGEGFFSNSLVRNSLSWTDARRPTPREYDPRVVFDRMFRTSASALTQKSVIDQVMEDARRLKRQGSAADQRKLDEYLEAVRSLERRLKFSKKQNERLASHTKLPFAVKRPPADIPADYEKYVRLLLDMIALAFWSDATRVCTFMLDHGQSNRYFNFIDGVQGTWHALSHWKDASGKTEDDDGVTSWSSPEQKRGMYNEVVRWHHRQVAYFLSNLKRIEDDGGNLLDNSMIVYGSNLADGHEHAARNLPLLVAGRAGGKLRSGRLVKYPRATSMSKLHLAALQNLGVPAERFGETTESLTEFTRA